MTETIRHREEEQPRGDRPPLSREVGERRISSTTMFSEFVKKFKDVFFKYKDRPELVKKTKEEMETHEKYQIKEGINFSRCQMDKVAADYKSGRKLEIDCFSPYLSDYNLSSGEIWENKLINVDEIGLGLATMLREIFSKSRLISLYDEYNTIMPDSSDRYGAPVSGAPQIVLSNEIKLKFKQEVERILRQRKAIKDDEKEGEDFLLISESEKVRDAEKFVEKLEKNGNYIDRNGGEINFINEDAVNPDYRKILLRSKNGHWTCEALDASSFIKPENLTVTHLVILPNHFKLQQDKVWEMLTVMGIKPEHYHNIFYDEKSDPKTVTRVIQEEINKYKD